MYRMETGIKGSDVYNASSIGNSLVALSALLTRGADEILVKKMVNQILSESTQENLEDLVVLAFQTRDIRGGKGERDLSRYIFEVLLNHPEYFKVILALLDLMPEYGCWQDLFKLASTTHLQTLRALEHLVKNQIENDCIALDMRSTWGGEELPKISLLAKWMPREGDPLANEMATVLFPGSMFHGTRMKLYRKKISALNKAINTVEIKMCGKDWSHIAPNTVPGRALNNYVKAFLNEKGPTKKGQVVRSVQPRCPGDQDRITCRENFQKYFSDIAKGKAVAKGADTLFPHEVLKKAYKIFGESCNCECDSDRTCDKHTDCQYLSGVWASMIKSAKEGGGLGRSLAMCDFSGSMRSGANGDTPYWVSMALGLLISEVTTDEFKNTLLSFDSTPHLHTLAEGSLFTKLRSFNPDFIGQGTSTDFQKAMDLVLAQCKARRVKPGEEPERLIVLTDMGWDQACGSSEQSGYTGNHYRHVVKTHTWQTHVEMIRESFKRAGEDMWGVGWKMPTIVIWNIAATCQNFHARADTEGVIMLSGWSPSLFKILQTESTISPEKALRIQIDNERYDPVRIRIGEFYAREGIVIRTPSKTSLADMY